MHHPTKRAVDRLKRIGFAEQVLLEGEDPNEFYDLCDGLLLEFSPCGPAQEECFRSIAKPLWRKLHPHAPIIVHRKYIPVAHAMTLYRLAQNGITVEEALEEAGIGRALNGADESAHQAAAQSDPQALKRQREIAAELDAEISQAIKQMLQLKQMNNAVALTR
jgi:hypothetical protein